MSLVAARRRDGSRRLHDPATYLGRDTTENYVPPRKNYAPTDRGCTSANQGEFRTWGQAQGAIPAAASSSFLK